MTAAPKRAQPADQARSSARGRGRPRPRWLPPCDLHGPKRLPPRSLHAPRRMQTVPTTRSMGNHWSTGWVLHGLQQGNRGSWVIGHGLCAHSCDWAAAICDLIWWLGAPTTRSRLDPHDLRCDQCRSDGWELFWRSNASWKRYRTSFWMRFRPLDFLWDAFCTKDYKNGGR